MKYAVISEDGKTVINVIAATPEVIAALKINAVAIADTVLCGPGDAVIDLKNHIFKPKEPS